MKKFSALFLLCALAFPLASAAPAEFSVNVLTKEKLSCHDMVEGFCDSVWSPAKLGNLDFQAGSKLWPLRLGRTGNDIPHTRFIFLQSLLAHFNDLPADIRGALKKTNSEKLIKAYLKRKKPAQLTVPDLPRPEYLKGILTSVNDAMILVSWERTEKQHPGFVRLSVNETSSEINRAAEKNLDLVWADVFTAVWQKHSNWQYIRKTFEELRAEYRELIQSDPAYSPALKEEMLADLQQVKLVIPGANPYYANSTKWHDCGIEMKNAFYSPAHHELTVCAGDFNSASALLGLAHELGHSMSIYRRVQNYWRNSEYGRGLIGLWDLSCAGKHFACADWEKFKKAHHEQTSSMKNYEYEDSAKLDAFIDKKLLPVPAGDALEKLAERFSKATVRTEMNSHYLESILKPEEILRTGSKVPNFRYLKACANSGRWTKPISTLDSGDIQFELFFSEEYSCQLEQKTPNAEALRISIEEATKMTTQTWSMLLRVPGRYSSIQEARDEEFAQDIEEDLVDSIAATVVARLLKKNANVAERRATYLASMAGYCDEPSFLKSYPEEAQVLKSFTNLVHSSGLDRRKKMLRPAIREALACE